MWETLSSNTLVAKDKNAIVKIILGSTHKPTADAGIALHDDA